MAHHAEETRAVKGNALLVTVVRSDENWVETYGEKRPATILTIGNFDGFHLGHQRLFRALNERVAVEGNRKKGQALVRAVLTFYPHPARVLRPESAPPLLMTIEQRLAAFDEAGIDAALVQRFDADLAKVSAEDFVRQFLVETMRAQWVLIGQNFRFGHKGAGDVNLLGTLGQRWGFKVEIVPPVKIEGAIVSSTAIRAAVREGRVEDAAKMLGRPFALEGEIRTGSGLGRKLVVPTLNLATEQECLPKNGVYATEAIVNGKPYRAATNVGIRPTFDAGRVSIESHLLGFSENLTGGPLAIRFLTRLRDEQKFSGPDALREQVLRDIARANDFFSAGQPQRANASARSPE